LLDGPAGAANEARSHFSPRAEDQQVTREGFHRRNIGVEWAREKLLEFGFRS
jgi:hypothetical protein